MYMESIIIVTTSPTNSPTNMYNYEIPLAPPITTTNSKLLLHYQQFCKINLYHIFLDNISILWSIYKICKSTYTTNFCTNILLLWNIYNLFSFSTWLYHTYLLPISCKSPITSYQHLPYHHRLYVFFSKII